MKRREMLTLAATVSAAATLAQNEVWERIAYALTKPSGMDEAPTSRRRAAARSVGAGIESIWHVGPGTIDCTAGPASW